MYIQQLYTGCLSEAAYYIESGGEAAIIDPLRDIDVYLQIAAQRKAVIKYIFETHFHADFISGHLDLAKTTGATIVYGPKADTGFSVYNAKDNEVFHIGEVLLKVLHTPGHTAESSCYLLKDSSGKDYAVFTGDTLFVGDVGRPDLSQKNMNTSAEQMAAQLYDSITKKLITLNDDVIVYPAHGQGSSCGKNLGAEKFSTIGEEKKNNYALQQKSKEDFVKAVMEGLNAPPQYFPINAMINKKGYDSMENILEKGLKALSVKEFKRLIKEDDTLVLDTRPATVFTQGFVPSALSIGLEGRFAEWAGSLISFDKKILLVTTPGQEKETVVRLARVGFDKVEGYLENGFEAWQSSGEPIDIIIDVEADELAMDLPYDDKILVLDVRTENEFEEKHAKDAVNIPLNEMTDPARLAVLEDTDNMYVHCGGGYRSVIASSILKKEGFNNLRNVLGGWSAMKEIPVFGN